MALVPGGTCFFNWVRSDDAVDLGNKSSLQNVALPPTQGTNLFKTRSLFLLVRADIAIFIEVVRQGDRKKRHLYKGAHNQTKVSSMSSRSAKTTPRAFVLAGDLIKSFIGTNRTFHILSGRLKGKKWIIGAGTLAHVAGIFKEAKMDKFDELITESSVVYDIGAQNGWYTLIASELVGPYGKVIAFEPLPLMAQYLKKHIEMNHCNNVQVIEAAVSDNDGTDTFFATKDGTLGAVSVPGLGHTERSTVKTIKLDSLLNKGAAPPPDYVKINIEGGELRALNGAESTLVDFAPTIFLATHSYDLCVACSDLLISKGYALEKIGTSKFHTRECIAQKK